MIDPKLLALIHAEIDGELDEHQRAELSRCLLADPEVRAARDQMRRLCQALDGLAPAEPPATLRTDILAALPQTTVRGAGARWPAPQWRFAAAVAGVLVAGTVVFRIMDTQEPAASEMAGTLAAPRTPASSDVVQLGQGPLSGQARLTRDGAELSLALDLRTDSPVDVLVTSGGHQLRLTGLGGQGGSSSAPATVALKGFGDDRQAGQTVNLTFLMSGREVAHAVLRAPE